MNVHELIRQTREAFEIEILQGVVSEDQVEGLYFAGHWAVSGGGVYGAAVSGFETAKTILGIR